MPGSDWLDPLPDGVDLSAVREVLGDDVGIDEDLRDLLGGEGDAVRDLLDARGHVPRIRPILVLLAARSAGGGRVDRHVLQAAEILHLALTVHDLALGQPGGRRRRVVRTLVKRSVAFFAGQQLTLRALEIARHAPRPELLSDVVDVLRSFSEGQALARELQTGRAPERQDWLEHADHTTGALFAFCCRAGAATGGDAAAVATLARVGRHLGRAWHVAEDVSALRLGDAASHLAERAATGRPVLPIALAIGKSAELGAEWAALCRDPHPVRAQGLVEAARTVGVDLSRATLARESWAARRLLAELPEGSARRALDGLAVGLARVAPA
jgi:geranylgeranyl pyrophosphate synthase